MTCFEPTLFLDGRVTLYAGDCIDVLATLPDNSVDSVVCDPPYHLTSIVKRFGADAQSHLSVSETKDLTTINAPHYKRLSKGFMGKQWDGGNVAFRVETWTAVLRVLKPGGYLLAFASTRGFGRMSVAIEDAGFITHPLIAWIFGSGFPKATRIKADGYDGFRYGGQALKPAIEPIYMGQKPFSEANGTANILLHGTGALNIDGCRVDGEDAVEGRVRHGGGGSVSIPDYERFGERSNPMPAGRWPANLIHDGSDEVLAAFPETTSTPPGNIKPSASTANAYGEYRERSLIGHTDSGSAARFFYTAKADAYDRISRHLEEVLIEWISESGHHQVKLQADTGQSLEKAIVVSASTDASGWNTFLCGSIITEIFRKASKCIISTTTNSTTSSRIWSLLTRLLTSGSTAGVSYETANGGSRAGNAENGPRSITITLDETVSLPGASRALSKTQLRISVSERRHSHPTVKPLDLMQYLCRLVTPPGGTVLDPFAGTGTTGEAAWREGFNAILIEREPEYQADIARRMDLATKPFKRAAVAKTKGKLQGAEGTPLFGDAAA